MATKKDETTIEPVQITLDTFTKEKKTGKVKKGKEHALIQTGASAEDAALVAGIINQSRSDSVTLSTIKGHQLRGCGLRSYALGQGRPASLAMPCQAQWARVACFGTLADVERQ